MSRNTRTELYRHFDDKGQLLYVGVSLSTCTRLAGHRVTACWFDLISRIEIERFETREAALSAEIRAIKDERPIYNDTHAAMRRMKPEGKTLSLTQVASKIGVSLSKMNVMLRDGRFPVDPLPRTKPRRWSVEAVDAWLNG